MSLEEWMWKWDLFSPVEWIMSCWGPQANISNLPQGTSSKILFWFQKDHACLLAHSVHAFKPFFFPSPSSIHCRLSELAVWENGPFPQASDGRTEEVQPFYLSLWQMRWGKCRRATHSSHVRHGSSVLSIDTRTTPDTLVGQDVCLLLFTPACLSLIARAHFHVFETCGFKYSPVGPTAFQRRQLQSFHFF